MEENKVIKRSVNDTSTRTKERARTLLKTISPTDPVPAAQQPTQPVAPEQKTVEQIVQTVQSKETKPAEEKPAAEPAPKEPAPKEPAPKEPEYVAADPDEDGEFNVDAPKPDDWKKIKSIVAVSQLNKELKLTARQLAEEKAQREKEIEELRSGLVVPEQVQSLTSRIQELEPFEKIYNLKNSPAYVEQITKPMNEEIAVLRTLEADYKLPQGVMQRVMDTENVAEQNRILSQYFDSPPFS